MTGVGFASKILLSGSRDFVDAVAEADEVAILNDVSNRLSVMG
jgi:hypothetical protein